MLVNIGSGVSFIKIDNKNYERINGTSLGGATFMGLCNAVTNISNFEQLLELSKFGTNNKIDLLIEDIYGGNYEDLGLDSKIILAILKLKNLNRDNSCYEY